MSAKEILQEALKAFGPDGGRWAKGYSSEDGHCAIHTCWMVSQMNDRPTEFLKAAGLLTKALPEGALSNVGFNDAALTTFPDIKAWFERAIQLEA